MPTNLAIDDKLIEEARLIGKHATKKGVVTEAFMSTSSVGVLKKSTDS